MTTPLADFLSLLVSLNVPGDKVAAVVAAAEAAFGGRAKSSGSTDAKRERWRAKKERQRARHRSASGNVPRGDRGDRIGSAIIEEIPFTDLSPQKKVSKRDSAVPPVPPGDKPAKPKRARKGDVLPDDWKPTEAHYALGSKLGFVPEIVDDFADRMRNWAHANEHRDVARKAGERGWNAAFSNWLKGAKDRITNNGGTNATNRNGSPAARGGSYATLAAKLRRGGVDGAAGSPPAGAKPPDGRPDPEQRLRLVDRSREEPPAPPAPHR